MWPSAPIDGPNEISSRELEMQRTSLMTTGLVLIFVGIQLNLVETFVLTPRYSNFLMEHSPRVETGMSAVPSVNNSSFNSPYSQAAFSGNSQSNFQSSPAMGMGRSKTISPPSWLCWPILFLGTVVFLHGLSNRRE